MKKSGVLVFLSLIVISLLFVNMPFALAADNDTIDDTEDFDLTGFAAAYDCLENLVKDRGYSDLTSEEQAFAMLALSYDSTIQGELRSALADSSLENRCWPSDDCEVKDTALVLIALEHINQPTNIIENWLIDEVQEPSDLVWYLQIDSSEATECTLAYEGGSREIDIAADKRLSGVGGTCFRAAFNGYWIEIDEDCFDDEFEISCESDFITSLAYRRRSATSDTPYYISSTSHSAPADGKTTEKVNSLCFTEEDSDNCDYEGSLWATLALKKLGKETDAYLPYLIALASSNDRYLPSSFLYMLTGDDEYFTELINEQNTIGYWQTTSDSATRYYDTTLGLLSLQGRSASQDDLAKDFLLENQPSSGCWRNARDTSFILYSAFPKNPSLVTEKVSCSAPTGYCISTEQDCEDATGNVLTGYNCPSFGKSVCCSVNVIEDDLPDVVPSGGIDENECEDRGYYCKSFCSDGTEEIKPYGCGEGIQDCCGPITQEESGGSMWWIWLLIILILLLILAIIYRNQVKIWVFRVKKNFKKGPVAQQRRPGPPGMPGRPGAYPQRRILPGQQRPGIPMRGPMRGRPGMPRRPRPGMPARPGQKPFPKEGALQETLKKLRDMGR